MKVDLLIINDIYTDFCVRLVKKNQPYGLLFRLTHLKDEPLVEFFDMRYDHTILGQFVTRYGFATVADSNGGLILDGGIPDWSVTEANMDKVRAWLNDWLNT
jgi:hypothetical protein